MTAKRAVMLVKKVTYFGEFGCLNSSCIRKVSFYCFRVPREINLRFCSKTHSDRCFLLISVRHVGAHVDGHQHKFGENISPHISLKKNCCDLNLGFFLFSRFWTLSIERLLFFS